MMKKEIRKLAEIKTQTMETRRDGDGEYIIEGYAAVYETKTVLGEIDGIKYHEIIRSGAHSGVDFSRCILLYDHSGKVLARVSNGSLDIRETARGLWFRASLKHSKEARELYEEIKAGLIDKMSWAFTVSKESYDNSTNTRIIEKIDKVYDISAVSAPAYQQTSVFARLKKQQAIQRTLRIEKIKAMIDGVLDD